MCEICERAFNVVSNLRRHMRTVHKETLSQTIPAFDLDGQPQLNIEGEDENDNIAVPEIDEEPPLAIVQT